MPRILPGILADGTWTRTPEHATRDMLMPPPSPAQSALTVMEGELALLSLHTASSEAPLTLWSSLRDSGRLESLGSPERTSHLVINKGNKKGDI